MNAKKKILYKTTRLLLLAVICCSQNAVHATELPALKIVSSADPDSNKVKSFIHVPGNIEILQGVKNHASNTPLRLQIPFVIDLPVPLEDNETIEWIVKTKDKYIGNINVLSRHILKKEKERGGFLWRSSFLQKNVEDRTRLVFRPKPLRHQQPIYKKGRGGNGKRQRYGGGTPKIDEKQYNPRLSYIIVANVKKQSGNVLSYKGQIAMDNKDMIRQEYINHFKINRYGRGGYGNLPVPLRGELSSIPAMPEKMLGNGLSESQYYLMVDDGLSELAINVVNIFENAKNNKDFLFKDLNKKTLPVPVSELWLSGGWRNPERNEWYSNALNGIHQRGGAIDIVANEPHSDRRSAIVYWFLWKALNKTTLDAFWQLETHGRPMTTREFKEDLEPKNGIPDAFDKADHMHINIKYD